ncbi:pyruvate, phosphate dikinase [Acidimicrobium ferrooxidans DSM 10331]|uniref:Pyruvate, phosphate dikinase n=1 Tax=Acidimicrobium ferrooxidans (strain DSM 10331 / JCM 15462 / NBRC 103882 / ICP) TaxID=525909 RepID=C7LZN5_ACIFD|nr:pyruvate, phosphate dikinase [Acidimicrobium ferrooxidans]ACU54193.1 pyruvate, phosphate dikinase [Acidimicrobium ferrooxidans DSM 10331]
MPFIYPFDHAHPVAPKELKALLGGKGANLAEMTSVLGLPVPPGFTISTDACRAYLGNGWPDGLDEELDRHVGALEDRMGRRLGDPSDPLLVSVRSGAQFSMPGMMDTVLNLGLNDSSVEGLTRQTNDERFAYDSYRRFIAMYARIVLGLDPEPFERLLVEAKQRVGTENDGELPPSELRRLAGAYLELVGELAGSPFPQHPRDQLRGAIEAVFRSWNGERAHAYREREGIPDDLGTAVNVQAMVFGNRDDRSGTGVGFTRDPATGEQGAYGDFLVNAQGEDVVAGIRITEPLSALQDQFPEVFAELMDVFARLERHFRDMCDVEFTIEQGKLWLLQTRVGKRTGVAALRMAVQMTKDPAIALTKEEAVARITPDHLDQVLHPRFAAEVVDVLTRGLGASPGAAVGRVYLDAASAVEAHAAGEPVILVRKETSPEDVRGMLAAEGILTTRGGLVSHAAVVARGWGKPAVVGADAIVIEEGGFRVGGRQVGVGDWISIDGTSGVVVAGRMPLAESAPPEEFEIVLGWADEIAFGKVGVRANADTADDAERARRFGAKGIGLCRTEHMFLQPDRLPIVRRMILAESPEEEASALEELFEAQRRDFRGILEVMSGLPVTVRLLDPPLHEFLPDVTALERAEAAGGLDDEGERLLAAARAWHEQNPMLGIRGVRLGVVKPGLYGMQVRALLAAAEDVARAGGEPIVEVMIPLTVSREELALARQWFDEARAASDARFEVRFGTMIETPRAALIADELAREADFFSFGTNDLTQMTFGFSRDDVEAKLMPAYLASELLAANPFKTVDPRGVMRLVRQAVEAGRRERPGLKVGVCGEHGGDPASIAQFVEAGLDYVSASPFRVPIARLAVAQSLMRAKDAAETA